LPAGQDYPVVLSVLSPRYRGLTVIDPFSPVLVAGSAEFLLQTASALIPAADGQLILPEADGLWLVHPGAWTVQRIDLPGQMELTGKIIGGENNSQTWGYIYPLHTLSGEGK
jgi:hypothetical protein